MGKSFVAEVQVSKTVRYRQKFDEKLGPTQLYKQEKQLVLDAIKEHDFRFPSISAFCREAVREKLIKMGYPVPDESEFYTDELPE